MFLAYNLLFCSRNSLNLNEFSQNLQNYADKRKFLTKQHKKNLTSNKVNDSKSCTYRVAKDVIDKFKISPLVLIK